MVDSWTMVLLRHVIESARESPGSSIKEIRFQCNAETLTWCTRVVGRHGCLNDVAAGRSEVEVNLAQREAFPF